MAEKSRTPRPPRPVQAPKRRDAQPTRKPPGRGSVPPWAWIAGVVAVAAIVGIAVAASGGSKQGSTANVKAAMLAAGCTYLDRRPFPPKHPKSPVGYHADVPSLNTPMKGLWSTFPPSGGGHYPNWAVWGFYTSPVNPRQVVHNMEHGAVVIWWGPQVPAATVANLRNFYEEPVSGGAGDALFGTPLTSIAGKSLGDKIALTSWTSLPGQYYSKGDYGIGHVAICPSFNQKAFATFRDAYRGKGPEGIPLSADEPGM